MADENAPATKRDLREMEDHLSERMKKDLQALDERLSEQMRDMQTELLKAFLPWQDNVRSSSASWRRTQETASSP